VTAARERIKRARETAYHNIHTYSQGCHRRSAGPPRHRPARERTLLRADKTEDRWRPGRPPPSRTPPLHRERRVYAYIHRRVAHIIPTAAAGAKTHEPFRTPYFISCSTHARRDVRAPPAERVEKKYCKTIRDLYIIITITPYVSTRLYKPQSKSVCDIYVVVPRNVVGI